MDIPTSYSCICSEISWSDWALIKSESCASVRLGAGLLRKCEFSFDQPSYNGPGAPRKHWCCAHEDPRHISPGEAKPGHQNAAQRHVFLLMILTAIWCSSMLFCAHLHTHELWCANPSSISFLEWWGALASHLEMIKLKPLGPSPSDIDMTGVPIVGNHSCRASPFDIPDPVVIKHSNGMSPVSFECSLGHSDFWAFFSRKPTCSVILKGKHHGKTMQKQSFPAHVPSKPTQLPCFSRTLAALAPGTAPVLPRHA